MYRISKHKRSRGRALDLTISTVLKACQGTKLWLDFGISTEEAGRYLNEGLIAQKEGFGGRTVVYETYELDTAGERKL